MGNTKKIFLKEIEGSPLLYWTIVLRDPSYNEEDISDSKLPSFSAEKHHNKNKPQTVTVRSK